MHCQSGVRAHVAARVLLHAGLDARNLSGGWLSLVLTRPDAVRP